MKERMKRSMLDGTFNVKSVNDMSPEKQNEFIKIIEERGECTRVDRVLISFQR
jgi:hypothetical protein